MDLRTRVKAAVTAVSSLFGNNTGGMTRAVRGGWGWLREPFAGGWQQGVQVDPLGALTAFSAVYACVSLISDDVGKLGLKVAAVDRTEIWKDVTRTHDVGRLLRRPNNFQTSAQFVAYWLVCKLLHGNAYILKGRRDGKVVALYVLDPRRVTPLVTPEGDVYYQLGADELSQLPQGLVVAASEIIHDRINCLWHPLVGIAPIVACAISATQGLRIQSNSAKFFENMSRPSGMLTAPATIDEVTAARLKKEWESNYGGSNIGRLAVLGDGLRYEPMTIPAEAAQLIEQLKWTVEDVARAFRVPVYLLNAGAAPTLNSVEALEQSYYRRTLQSQIEAIEQCLDLGLDLPATVRTEFDLDGLLRMDSAAMFESLSKGVSGGWLAPNEARARLNLPPVDGGESPLAQQQNYSLSALAKRDAMPDPFSTAAAGST